MNEPNDQATAGYEIRKTLFGKVNIHYPCPNCGERLQSPLSDAGTADNCPDCGTRFEVPGAEAKQSISRNEQAVLAPTPPSFSQLAGTPIQSTSCQTTESPLPSTTTAETIFEDIGKKLSPDENDDLARKLAFMKANRGLIEIGMAEYLVAHPDTSPEDVVDIVTEKYFLEHEIERLEVEIEAESARIVEQSSSMRPLGNLTHEEASRYFAEYCELLERGCGMREPESNLPTSFDQMKEALRVECLNWCAQGRDFDESCDFIGRGYMMLSRFVPVELAIKRPGKLADGSNIEAWREHHIAFRAANEFIERRTNELVMEWDEFRMKYRTGQMPKSPSLSNAAQPHRPATALVSKSGTREATKVLLIPLPPGGRSSDPTLQREPSSPPSMKPQPTEPCGNTFDREGTSVPYGLLFAWGWTLLFGAFLLFYVEQSRYGLAALSPKNLIFTIAYLTPSVLILAGPTLPVAIAELRRSKSCVAGSLIAVLALVVALVIAKVCRTPEVVPRLGSSIEDGKPPIGVSPETFEQLKNAAKERFEQLPGVTEHQRTFEQLIVDWVDDHQGQSLPEQYVMSGWIQEMRAELRRELVASPEFQTVLDRINHLKEPEGLESAEIQRELERLTQQWALRRMDADQLLAEFERKYQRWLQDSQEVYAPAGAQEPRNPFQEFTGASAKARSHYLRGLAAAHNQEDFESAVQQFTEAIRIDPNYAEAYVARGCARLHNFNEHDLAIEDHTKAIGLQPDYALAYLHRADTYLEEGQDYLEALNDCNKAISLSPGFAHAFWLRSQVLTKLKEHERAKFDLERAEQLGFVGDGRWYPWHDESWQYWQTLKLKDFSIEIPDGWVSASGPELREYEKLMKSRTGMSKSYDFGIQPSGRHVYFMEPPFILGTFKPDQKNTDEAIEAMAEQLNKQFQSVDSPDWRGSDSAVLKHIFDNSTIQRPYLDVDTKCIYSTLSTQTPAYGLVHAVTVQRFSPHGAVVLHAYVSDNSKKKHIRVINRMMSSISFFE